MGLSRPPASLRSGPCREHRGDTAHCQGLSGEVTLLPSPGGRGRIGQTLCGPSGGRRGHLGHWGGACGEAWSPGALGQGLRREVARSLVAWLLGCRVPHEEPGAPWEGPTPWVPSRSCTGWMRKWGCA